MSRKKWSLGRLWGSHRFVELSFWLDGLLERQRCDAPAARPPRHFSLNIKGGWVILE
jgi:hypothetical protein